MPEYIGRFKEFEGKGVKGVYVLSVNDIFVMKAWKKDLVAKAEGGDSQVVFGESKSESPVSPGFSSYSLLPPAFSLPFLSSSYH